MKSVKWDQDTKAAIGKLFKIFGKYRDFFGSDLSKMDQTWSNWISRQSKNVTIKRCHIYKKDKNGCFSLDFFGTDPSKMDQTWSNLIKLDFSPIKKCYYMSIKSYHIYRKDENGRFVFDFFGSDLSKMDQTWSNLIKLDFLPIKKCCYKKLSHLQKG